MTLTERLVERIRARGPMTFADFMDAALYDPQDGYYTTHAAIGFDGADFLTSPELGPAFGRALARAAIDCWSGLGKPAAWDVVEAGAGRGILMRDLLDALGKEKPEAARSARPAIVEVSPRLREQQALALEGRELRWASVARTLAPIRGVVFANEVLDAFPVHVLVRADDGVREVYVDAKDGVLVETLRAPSHPDLRYRMPDGLPVGGRWEVSLGAESWVAQLAAAMVQGYLVIVDYGGDEASLLGRGGVGTVRGFSRHRLVNDALAAPGHHDLTASVNVTAIRRAAEGAGLTLAGITTQRDALIGLGVREQYGRPLDPLDQLRAASKRSAIDVLLEPNGLGAYVVLCFAKDAPADGLRFLQRP
ncbi:MAG TPA: SAM-dependent methyltransferase [Candidatus Limnocylindria bacterium]|nr:SAM-dependent methyltransferase [Candidatus Limnocylindria bacterium]